MGKPAARIGDPTAHGGTLGSPASLGCLTVLIGGQPAARAGDMHVCPLSNGPVPHIGGAITMGSTTVFIGGLPAARVGDTCACLGPPNTIIPPGCLTVLIGD